AGIFQTVSGPGLAEMVIKKSQKTLLGLAIGTGAALLALLLWTQGSLDRWEFATWAWRVEMLARPGPATSRVKIILLDQASLDWGKETNGWPWPWPRQVYGPIIDFCRRGGARTIIFDVLYTEPSVYGVADDELLAAAIRRAPSFVAPLSLGTEAGAATSWPSDIPGRSLRFTDAGREWVSLALQDLTAPHCAFPIPEVAAGTTLLGNVMDDPDSDGIFRRAGLFRVFDGRAVPSLGLAGYIAGGGPNGDGSETLDSMLDSARLDPGRLGIGGRRFPLDESHRAILRFRGPSETHETFSAAAVIQSELRLREGGGPPPVIGDPAVFKDCHVLFGFSAQGLMDLRPTPVSRVFPGVEIHATVLDNLLSEDFLRDVPRSVVVPAVLLLAVFSALTIVHSRKARHSVLLFGAFLPIPVLLGLAAYEAGFWWPIVVQEGALVVSMVGALGLNYATEGRQKAFYRHAFKHYLSPVVIDRLLDDPSKLKLGGERRELSIFFSDLQGFSSISERLDPTDLTTLLNDYLSDMTDIILEEEGTVDKYEGDAIIAFWNAPLDQPDHALRASRAAVRCQQKLLERSEEFLRRAGVPMRMRIGINTGAVVVGNMGSRQRFDYTVLGDAANLASRLEGANKAFGTATMIAESTWEQTGGRIRGREIGLLRVVGRQTPVRVFEPLLSDDALPGDQWPLFHRGLAFCYEYRWAEALEVFSMLENDPVAKTYAERCRDLLEDPFATWDAVWNLTQK
ncbi:MAG TPA: adenylate/guanylate cyclase domain-containing protein, partial [Syntrophobacteraceae bacterium]|nr:adenylate/guanylate cyclase domain-containing protein [Syntrophobacteraceae bacterium]